MNMSSNILIVGCGNIGSRHLQSLERSLVPLSITIIEPNMNSQKIAKSQLEKNSKNSISWLSSISELNQIFDLVIIATSAEKRKSLVDTLLDSGNKKFLLEKMVCQSESDYKDLIENFNKHDASGWVNTNRRYFPFYQKLKNIINLNDNLKISITTGNKGLGSNAIHFIDLFLWLKNSNDISLIGDFLTDKLYSNKRGNQYYEFSGTIFGKTSNSILKVSFLPVDDLPLILDIETKDFHILISETDEKILKIKNLEKFESSFKYFHVSDLTLQIVSDILENNFCYLPKVQDLFIAHCELFKIFNSHVKKLTNKELTLCPIT